MVKNFNKLPGNKSVAKLFSLLVSLLVLGILSTIFLHEYFYKDGKTDKTSSGGSLQKMPGSVETCLNNKISEIPEELFIRCMLREGVFLAIKADSKDIYAYDVKENAYSSIIKVRNSDKYIKNFACNTQWIVWVESEDLIPDTSNKPFKWEMIAQNVSTGEQIVVDRSQFTTNRFKVPMFINYTPDQPDQLDISDKNIIVYCKTRPDNSKIKSELVLYDLNEKLQKTIAETDDVTEKLISSCSIHADNVVWSEFRELNDDFNFRLTQYKYCDIFNVLPMQYL